MRVTGLLLFIPISLILAYGFHSAPLWVFAAAGLAIIPIADWIRRATNQLAGRTGPAIGGLVNVTFGSIAELTLALFVLSRGHTTVVRAQITGSLIGTSLLGLGLAIVAGAGTDVSFHGASDEPDILQSPELIAIVGMVFVVNSIAADGETTWFEGDLLVAVYVLLGIAFYFATP